MLQFYFLSVLLNAVTGVVLILTGLEKIPAWLQNRQIQLTLGIATAATGILKLFIVGSGSIPILGDLLPAAAGICGGAAILFACYHESVSAELKPPAFVEKTFIHGKKYLGFACVAAALLHFLFPSVVLL